MRARTLLATVVVPVLIAAAGVSADALTHPSSRPALSVLGFQSEGDPRGRIDASAAALDAVDVDGVNLRPSGASVRVPDAPARAQLARAHADHLRGELLFGNFDAHIEDFSEPLAHRLLRRPAHRRAVAAQLARTVRRQGWDGVNVDLESLARRDTAGLVRFLHRLRADLPGGRSITVDLMAATSGAGYRAWGYDVPAVAASVDRIELMTYDQHGPWENRPGPVGSLAWTRRCLDALLAAGASAGHVDLGVAGYGYAWRPHSNDTLSDAGARRLVRAHHATPRWDARAAEWTATLPDGSVVWWSDARSYRARYGVAAAAHLRGVAVWSLGQSDPIRTG